MTLNPLTISGKEETSTYLAQLTEEQAAGHLLLLPPDHFHQKVNENWINRRYLDQRTGEIFSLKGRIDVHDQNLLERRVMRTRKLKANKSILIDSFYRIRLQKPPLFGGFLIHLAMDPPKSEGERKSLTIDLSKYDYRISNDLNRQLIEGIVVSSIARSFATRTRRFSAANVVVNDLLVHHIDTGLDTIDYVVRRCIDQAFDDGTEAPTVEIEGGLRLKKINMQYSYGMSVDIINGKP